MKKTGMSTAGKVGISVGVSILSLAALTYVALSFFFEDHYYYNTYINGKAYSYKTPVEADDILYGNFAGYSLEITGREESHDILLPAEIDMRCSFEEELVEIKRQQSKWLWFLGFFKSFSYELEDCSEYDRDLFEKKVDGLVFFRKENIRAPSDAFLSWSDGTHGYVVTEGNPGTELNREKTKEALAKALEELSPVLNLEEAGCYKNAQVTKEDPKLQLMADVANRYLSARITYNWNGNEVTVDRELLREWIRTEKDGVSLDEEKIAAFVKEQAKKYDTYGKNREFTATDGRQIELKSSAYGWKTDTEAESKALTEAVKKGETLAKEPAYIYTAAEPGQTDIGNSYVEIDLGKQHLYLYVDGALILESDFVSGNMARGYNTPAGVYGLTYKTKDAVLRGEDYETPVNFWMPFNGNIGMHDAVWRSAFGGEIYQTNGSHGCINLPYDNAKIIYEYMYTGFPVVCYY